MSRTFVRYAIATALIGTACAVTAAKMDLATVLADPARPEADRARDADRKPAEVISFAGVKAGSTIAELAPAAVTSPAS